MLSALSIHGFALIDHLQIELDRGLNVLTGETGAGKSIMLDAIGLLLGNRANAEFIRNGHQASIVEGLFHLDKRSAVRVNESLVDWGFDPVENEVVVVRELHRSGRTVCRINGRMATVQMLKELGSVLVQQHGQHEAFGLMKPDEQLRLLDLYGRHDELLGLVNESFGKWDQARQALDGARINDAERARRLDMLNFQIEEIEQVKLQPGEEEQLRAMRQTLAHAEKILEALQESAAALDGHGNQAGAIQAISLANRELSHALQHDQSLQEIGALLDTAHVHVQEASHAIHQRLRRMDLDPGALEQVEERLMTLRGLQRKYGANVEDVLAYLEKAKAERHRIATHEEQVERLEREVDQALVELQSACERLHAERVNVAERLSRSIQEVLRHLNMPKAVVKIHVQVRKGEGGEVRFRPDGFDQVLFLFSANAGEEPKPLSRIASGGELSRTLLAVKVVLAEVDDIDTIVFDEIDSGVSGNAAQRIAEQLCRLGTERQVLCITHSAQVAAAGHFHHRIEKVERQGSTVTQVYMLDAVGRVEEIMRLVGIGADDAAARHHAESLLRSFHPTLSA